MGYANTSQIGTGLRQRLYSRAFIIGETENAANRFVYLVLDTQSGDTAIRDGILKGIAGLGSEYAVYKQANVAVTGTHSHSGPAAWLNYLLPQITSKGFDDQSYQAIVGGAVRSVKLAHESLTNGKISVGTSKVNDANINRSLFAYQANPAAERDRYGDDVDRTMTLLKFTRDSDGKDIGVLNWFAVHGTSMLGNNTIVSGDNKGVAAYLFEQAMKGNQNAAAGFVAGFSQANVGDTTPNVNGAWCEDGSNTECDFQKSTCGGKSQDCRGRGPFFGLNDGGTKSCYEIGKRQNDGAMDIYSSIGSSGTPVAEGAVRSFHTFVDMSTFTFTLPNGTAARTCPAALGYSFAAGTSDGPGAFDFTQNDPDQPDASPVWAVVSSLLKAPSKEQKACHAPKPILLDVGETKVPYDWSPNIVDMQILRVGQLIIIVSPSEATTMSGRRWREAIHNAAISSGVVAAGTEPVVVIGGPANTYAHYVVTEEEYGIQRYEGASTLYGRNQLNAYINATVELLPFLADSATTGPDPGPSPPINTERSLKLNTGVVYDGAPIGKKYGDVLTQPVGAYTRGSSVSVRFQAANPRNNLRLGQTYAAIEQENSGSWTQVKSDDDWELLFEWKRTNDLLGHSEVSITWDSAIANVPAGTYRVKYYGDSKSVTGKITGFTGTSSSFTLT